MKNYILLSVLVFAISCKTSKNNELANNSAKDSVLTNENILINATIGRIDQATDPISISGVRVKGTKMFIDISYGGGCKDHQFQLIGSTIVSKSLPPVRAIQLVHVSNGDMCKMNVMKTLEIDITELAFKKENGSTIYLSLGGWNQQIEYRFEEL